MITLSQSIPSPLPVIGSEMGSPKPVCIKKTSGEVMASGKGIESLSSTNLLLQLLLKPSNDTEGHESQVEALLKERRETERTRACRCH